MAVNTYECLFLLDPNRASADLDGVMAEANGIIERNGGEIVHTRPWGEPKLAYPIGKFKKGMYILTYFRCDSQGIPEMEKECRLSETILRQLILKLPRQIADDIIAHITGEGTEGEEVAAGVDEQSSET